MDTHEPLNRRQKVILAIQGILGSCHTFKLDKTIMDFIECRPGRESAFLEIAGWEFTQEESGTILFKRPNDLCAKVLQIG